MRHISLLALMIVLALRLTTSIPPALAGCAYDGEFYGAMAAPLSSDAWHVYQAPWCWRVLTPYFISLLPWPVFESFLASNLVFNWLNLVLVGWLAQRVCSSRSAGVGAMLLYAGVFWSIKFSFYCPCYIDVQTQTVFLGALCLMELKRYRALVFFIALGALQKESALLLAPVAAVQHYSVKHDRKAALLYLVLILAAAAAALALVRVSIAPVNQYLSEGAFRQQLAADLQSLFELRARIFTNVTSGLGLLWLIVIWRARALADFIRKNPHWAALILLGILPLFAGTDKGRFFLYMLPAITILAVAGIKPILERLERGERRVVIWAALTLVIHFYIGHLLTATGKPEEVFSWVGQWPAISTADAYRMLICAALWIALTCGIRVSKPC